MKTNEPRRRTRVGVGITATVAGFAFSLSAMGGTVPSPWNSSELATAAATTPADPYGAMEMRLDRMDLGLRLALDIYDRDVQPVEFALRFYSDDEVLVRRIALALVREGEAVGIDPRVLTSVLLVENPWLDPTALSRVGAVGLMQVMPMHAGNWGCPGSDLTDVDINICHGARVFERALLDKGGDVDRALLAYNGCVRGTVTPDCHLYPAKVYTAAGKTVVRQWLDVDASPSG